MVCGILLLAHDKSERVSIHQATVFEERVMVIAHDCYRARGWVGGWVGGWGFKGFSEEEEE